MTAILNGLCAAAWTHYIPDILVAIFVIVMMIVCGIKGFISCFFCIISTFVAFFVAISLAKVTVGVTGGLFGLEDLMASGIEKAFSNTKGFNVDISAEGVQAAIENHDVSAVLARLIIKSVGKGDVPVGTTLASLIGEATAGLAATLLVGILLFFIVKLLMLLLKAILNGVAENMAVVGGVNVFLGVLYGLFCSLMIVSAILAVAAIIPIPAISKYFDKTLFVHGLYNHNLLIEILSWFI